MDRAATIVALHEWIGPDRVTVQREVGDYEMRDRGRNEAIDAAVKMCKYELADHVRKMPLLSAESERNHMKQRVQFIAPPASDPIAAEISRLEGAMVKELLDFSQARTILVSESWLDGQLARYLDGGWR